ncbi:MAG: hypothetical protein AAF915_15150 [Cyanobacteria bacterium P01_D01_bin.50]
MHNYFEQNQTPPKSPIKAQETSEGFLFINSNFNLKEPKHIFFIIYLIVVLILILNFQSFNLFWRSLLFIGIIAFFLNKSFRNYIFAQFRLSGAKILLSTYPLRLGEECNLTFRRRLRGNRKTKQLGELSFKIACLERIQFKRGTDTEIEVHVIWESQPKIYSVPTNSDMLSFKTDFRVPDNLPPSFEGKNNQIRWIISVEQNISGIIEQVNSNFVFIVDPVLIK